MKAGAKEANNYLRNMRNAIGDKLVHPDSIYSGVEGHKRLAREIGPALNDFDEKGQEEILHGSYSTIYVVGCNLKPILDAKEWTREILSRVQ